MHHLQLDVAVADVAQGRHVADLDRLHEHWQQHVITGRHFDSEVVTSASGTLAYCSSEQAAVLNDS